MKQRILLSSTEDPETKCWEWDLYKQEDGYGVIKANGKAQLAHRVSYEAFKGSPEDMHVCHTCDNPGCVNPEHLFLGTNQDNVTDKMNKGRHRSGGPAKSGDKRAKLTSEDVLAIRQSTDNQPTLATQYGVSQATISNIKRRVVWTHI